MEQGYKIIEEIKKFKTVHNILLNEKVLVITYKKGKNNLGELIDFLKENNVKGTFFITGHYLNTKPELVQKMIENGNTVGNHTVNHKSMPEIDLNKIIEIKDKNLKLSIQQELGLPGEIRLGDIRELTSLTVKNKEIKSLEGLQYAVNLESLNIQNNEIKDLSPLKNLKKLTNLKANSQNIYEDWVWAKGQGVSVNYDIINRKGQKLSPTSIVIKDNRTWKMTTLNIAECIDQNGIISFSTENFYKGIHTVYLTYEDKTDNYKTELTFLLDNRLK